MPDASVPEPRPGQCQNTVFKRDKNSKGFVNSSSSEGRGGGGSDPSLTFINPVQPGNFPDPGVLQLQGRLGTTDITTDKMLHSLYPF